MADFTRRGFIRNTFAGVSGAFLAIPALKNFTSYRQETSTISKKVITRKLGKTGIELPIVSFGVMRADNPALVRAALKAGVVHLDTAHGYQGGKNEEMLGNVLKDYPRDSFVISTKVGPEGKEGFLAKLDISLKRLQMDHVDILYLHGPSSREDVLNEEYLAALKEAKASGKTKHIGVSTHKNEPEVIQAAVDSGVYEVVLSSINFKQDHYADVKKAVANAAKAGIGIVAMKTMAGGFLDKDRKKPVNCKAALKWVLQDENVTTAIPGVTTFDQLEENVTVNEDLALTESERSDLAMGNLEGGLYCQACEECVPACKNRLPVPELMRAYMYTYGYGSAAMGRELITTLHVQDSPCSGCNECTVVCRKGFPVHEKITDIVRLQQVPAEFLA